MAVSYGTAAGGTYQNPSMAADAIPTNSRRARGDRAHWAHTGHTGAAGAHPVEAQQSTAPWNPGTAKARRPLQDRPRPQHQRLQLQSRARRNLELRKNLASSAPAASERDLEKHARHRPSRNPARAHPGNRMHPSRPQQLHGISYAANDVHGNARAPATAPQTSHKAVGNHPRGYCRARTPQTLPCSYDRRPALHSPPAIESKDRRARHAHVSTTSNWRTS